MKTMKTHWVADLFPLNETDVEALAEDIKSNGQIVPIKALKDGQIIDGRNRWLACRKAGVDPVIDIVNPDGEEVPEEQLFALATSCNSIRRDLTTAERAVAAAQAWKRLYEDGKLTVNKGGRGKLRSEDDLGFVSFAKTNFKAGRDTAKQALAIANHSPELLELAKNGLDNAYRIYQEEKARVEEEHRNQQLLKDHPDIRERVANGAISMEEAITLARARSREQIEKAEAVKQQRHLIAQNICQAIDRLSDLARYDVEALVEIMETELPRTQVSSLGHVAETEAIAKAAAVLARLHEHRSK